MDPVTRLRQDVARRVRGVDLPVTKAIIGLCVVAYVAMIPGGTRDWALYGPAVAAGEWWRLVTSGFVHYGLVHLAFNMYVLWLVGRFLEPAAGSLRFFAIYTASLLAGAAGALILDPNALTGGASGAVFGVAAAATLALTSLGVSFGSTGFGPLLVVNLLLGFVIANVSVGGHLGGLLGGLLCAAGLTEIRERGLPSSIGLAWCAAVGVGAVALALRTVA